MNAKISAGVLLIVVTAGCGGLMGGGSLSFSAGAVHVADGAVSESGFDVVADKEVAFERSVEVQGQSKTVEMEAHMVQLERSFREAPSARALVLAVPQVEVLGQQIDVAERVGAMSFVDRARGSSADIEREQKVGERSASILGGQRTVEVFRGTAKREGESAKVKVYVTTFDHRGDTIIAVGIVPQAATDSAAPVMALFEGIRYSEG